jgi:hypothetical protein
MVKAKASSAKKQDKVVLWLFAAALIIQVLNTFISYKLGVMALNQCPRTLDQQTASMSISLFAAAVIIAAIVRRRDALAISYGIFFLFLIACWGFVLWLIAAGGMNWCDYHW